MTGPPGLFVLLFGVPALLLALVFAAVAVKAPRGGAMLCGMLLVSVAPLLFGVDRVSYMKGAGMWLTLSVAISAIGLLIAVVGLVRGRGKATSTNPEG